MHTGRGHVCAKGCMCQQYRWARLRCADGQRCVRPWDACMGKVCACQCNVHVDARICCAHPGHCMCIRMRLSRARHVDASNALLRRGKLIPLLANSDNMDCSIHWTGEAKRLLTRQMYLSQHYVCRGSARYPHFKTIMLLV